MTEIVLIRHAESFKNLKDIHGGNGEQLTCKGKTETKTVCEFLSNNISNQKSSVLFCPENIQTTEMADIIIQTLNITYKKMIDIIPLDMGEIKGKSNAEVKQIYPNEYDRLQLWRNRKIEINELKLPGMENPQDFFARGERIINKIELEKTNVFILTTSLFILLANIMLGKNCNPGGGYKHMNIDNCGIAWFNTSDLKSFILNKELTNVEDVITLA